jgi:hypothetical protein
MKAKWVYPRLYLQEMQETQSNPDGVLIGLRGVPITY